MVQYSEPLLSLRVLSHMLRHGRSQSQLQDICIVCEWIYDPAVGDPDGGIAPGTSFEDIPDDWVCPVCGVGKDQFEEVEE